MRFIRFYILFLSVLLTSIAFSQAKLNATSIANSSWNICGDSAFLDIELRNITTTAVQGIELSFTLPKGMYYISNSAQGGGISEKNISNLNAPEFTASNIAFTKSAKIKIGLSANCAVADLISSGKIVDVSVKVDYTGGSISHKTKPLTIQSPSVTITKITNQLVSSKLGSKVIRNITIANTGSGSLSEIIFFRTSGNGIKQLGSTAFPMTQRNDTFFNTLSSNSFLSIGNKNNSFDRNETITITDTVLVDACSQLKTDYFVQWGCGGEICSVNKQSANITISPVSPILKITPVGGLSKCLSYANSHPQRLYITNTGSDSAYQVFVQVYQAASTAYYAYMLSELVPTTFSMQWGEKGQFKFIDPANVTGTNRNGTYGCLSSIPIGLAGFNLPNIAPGDTLILNFDIKTCCNSNCKGAGYMGRWRYDFAYEDQCKAKTESKANLGNYGFYQSVDATPFFPTDVVDGDTALFKFNLTRAYFIPFGTNSKLTVVFKLPKGISHSLNKSDFIFEHDNGSTWQPNTLTQKGDSITAVFIGYPKVTLARSHIKIFTKGDCSAIGNSANSEYSLRILYNPDPSCVSTCTYPLFCDKGSIRYHCQKSCKGGLGFRNFKAHRINFNRPDNNNDGIADPTGKIDLDKVAVEKVMAGDTLLTQFHGKVLNANGISSWRYGKATSTISMGRYLNVAEARIQIFRNGGRLYDCKNVSYTASTSGDQRVFTYDVSYSSLSSNGCPLYTTFAYASTDSIVLSIKYVADNIGGLVREVNIENQFYLSTVASPTPSQKYQCDTFGGKFIHIGYYFTNWGRNIVNNKGCDDITISQNYYLSVGNCCTNYAGNNIFPYEARTFALLEKITFFTPEGYQPLHFSLRNVRTQGTGLVKVESVDTIRPTNPGNDTLTFATIQHYSKEFKLPDDGFYGIFTAKLRPTCKTPLSSSIPVHYQFDFREQGFLGNNIQSYFSSNRGDVINYEKPLLKLATQQTDVVAAADTVQWTINLTNSSPTARAEHVWIGASADPQIELVKIIDTKTGKEYFPVNNIFKLGGFPPAVVNTFDVVAAFSLCQPDSLIVYTGSDCFEYPDSLGGYECSADQLVLRYTTSTTTLESTLAGPTSEVDLCEPQRYSSTISNIGKADVYDLKLKIYARNGMTIKDSVWLFLPDRSDSLLLSKPRELGANIWEIDLTSNDSPLDTTSFKGARQTANTLHIKYEVDTDCEFISSSVFFIQPVGVLKCGDPVEGIYAVSQPLNIKGIKKSYFSSVSFAINEIDFCENVHYATAKFINLGPDTTKVIDGFELDLPSGISIDTNYVSNIINGPQEKPVFISKSNRNSAQWILPSGLQPGDSSVFNLKLLVNHNKLTCDFNQIYFYAVIQDSALCVKTNQYCTIKAATSSGFIADSIKKAEFVFTFKDMKSVIQNGLEVVRLNYGIRNTNRKANSGSAHYVSVYADVNRNAIKDSGDVFITGDTILQALSDTNTQRTLHFNVNSEDACNLLLVVDSGMCQCDLTTIALPPTQLENAGMDMTICSNLDTVIGTEGVSGLQYQWQSYGNMNRTDTSLIRFNWFNNKKQDTTIHLVLSTIKQFCRSNDTVAITLHPEMTNPMNYNAKMCKNGKVNIGSVVAGGKGAKSHSWTPTEGLARTKFAFTESFPDSSKVYYRTTWDQNGCFFYDSVLVDVKQIPIAKIESSPACFGDSIHFNDSTQYFSPFRSMTWDLGNDSISTDSMPVVLYDSSGIFYVELIVEDIYDCRDTAYDTLEMFPFPYIVYDSMIDVCKDDSVTLINKGSIDYGTFTSIWDLGYDTLYGDTVGTRIDAVGISYIHLKMISDQGCQDELNDTLHVYTIPSASITMTNHCLGDSIAISATSNMILPDSIASYQWNIGGMGLTDTFFKYQFQDSGWQYIDLTLQSDRGCVATQKDSLFVYDNPHAAFILNSKLCEEDSIKILDRSFNAHGNIVNKKWIENQTIEHQEDSLFLWVPANESLRIQLHLESEFGCVDSVEQSFQSLTKEVPHLTVTGNCEDHPFSFQFTPNRPDSLLAYQLQLDPEFNSNQIDFIHTFKSHGDYTLTQKTISTSGCETDTTYNITVYPRPFADFTIDYPCEDVRTRFVSLSTTPLGKISQYNWDVSSIISPTDSVAQVDYLDTGTYPIRLEVTNSFGCTDTAFGDATPPTKALLDLKFGPICQFDEQVFEDATTGLNIPVTTRIFDMGNSDTIKQSVSFPYAYQGYGTFDIKLILVTRPNCIYTYTSPITVDPKPVPGFIVTPSELSILNPIVTIVDRSVNAPLFQYFISDGSNYLNPTFIHEFVDSGHYEITQIVRNPLGCADTLTKQVFVEFATTQFMPTAFTPNGDGYNDLFEPKGLGIDRYELQVYNRWGAKVFESTANQSYWKGTDQDPGTYMYVIKIMMLDGRYTYRKGMVSLIR